MPQRGDQYVILTMAYSFCSQINIDRKMEDDDIFTTLENFSQGLCGMIKNEMSGSLMFPDEDHAKKCKKTKESVYIMSTSKEPEVL